MPIYEYKCPNGHVFELFQRFADAPIEVCQVCGASPVVKVLYPAAVHFKGSGFYSTDYGKGGRKRTPESGGSSEGGGSSESSSSSSEGSSSSSGESAPKTEKAETPKKSSDSSSS